MRCRSRTRQYALPAAESRAACDPSRPRAPNGLIPSNDQGLATHHKHVGERGAEEALGCSRAVGAVVEVVMHRSQCLQAGWGDAMQAVVSERELPIATLHAGAGALQ